MSFAVIESRAGFNSARTEPLAGALDFVLWLVGVVVHANANVGTADTDDRILRLVPAP
jgi:hypothetical protein